MARNCTIGRSCGSSCVSRNKKCVKELSPEAAKEASYLARIAALKKVSREIEGAEVVEELYGDKTSHLVLATESYGGDMTDLISLEVMAHKGQNGLYFEIAVNGSFEEDDSFSKADKLRVARDMRNLITETVLKLPDGEVLWGVASGATEKHRDSLIRWYSKIGFNVKGGTISSIIRDGKLTGER